MPPPAPKPVEASKPFYVRLFPRPIRSAYRRVVPRFLRVFFRERPLRFWMLLIAYILGQWFFNRLQFGVVFLIFAGVVFIFYNLNYSGRRSGLSAYSVFNPGQERLIGTYDATEYDRMLRNGGVA